VAAALDHLAVLQHDDAVGIADGGEAVGDDEAGAALQQLGQRLLDLPLGVAVDIGRGLVEHQDLGVGDQRAGEAQQLALAQRQVAAALLELGVVALGSRMMKSCAPDRLGRAITCSSVRIVLW
jgi:hypothetical protein